MQLESSWPPGQEDSVVETLSARYANGRLDLDGILNDPLSGRIALVSSFGAEAAVLLHKVSKTKADIDILFLDTEKHFDETLEYLETLRDHLELPGLRLITPDPKLLEIEDSDETLHKRDPGMCCTIRKSFPLQDALVDYDGWITGRKRYQGGSRANIPYLERDGKHLKINPLIHETPKTILEYFKTHKLPSHSLVNKGYKSIGCKPCTISISENQDHRAGRWAGIDKAECGIHLSPDGSFSRGR